MIRYTQGNLLDADVDALVNTVNTVGVMGKGIALMFKEAFPENYREYSQACENERVKIGKMYVTSTRDLLGNVKWIINFPTKKHWRHPSKIEWIEEGLEDLKKVINETGLRSIALPPLGSGNGGLDWLEVKEKISEHLSEVSDDVDIIVYEPTEKYQNTPKTDGVRKLTPARALTVELIRRYSIVGMRCSLLEAQKLAWFLERTLEKLAVNNSLQFQFKADKFGPYAMRLHHLLNQLDGSYIRSEKRIADAGPLNVIEVNSKEKESVESYLATPDMATYSSALDITTQLIDGFESPLGMELLATVDWLIEREGCTRSRESIKEGLKRWPAGKKAGNRKMNLFNDDFIDLALERLNMWDQSVKEVRHSFDYND